MKKIYLSLEESNDNQELVRQLKKYPEFEITELTKAEKITVITNGPLTDLSNKLMADYTLRDSIEQILLVGGSDSYGDVTICAEKNIYADPKAAQHVFISGIPIVMFGLNVTKQLANRALAPLVYLTHPEIFQTEECGVYVETLGKITLGKTVTDIYADKQFEFHNVQMVKAIDMEKYNQIING